MLHLNWGLQKCFTFTEHSSTLCTWEAFWNSLTDADDGANANHVADADSESGSDADTDAESAYNAYNAENE